jgi:hypothetical protein
MGVFKEAVQAINVRRDALHWEVKDAESAVARKKAQDDGKAPTKPTLTEVYGEIAKQRGKQHRGLPSPARVSREMDGWKTAPFPWRLSKLKPTNSVAKSSGK